MVSDEMEVIQWRIKDNSVLILAVHVLFKMAILIAAISAVNRLHKLPANPAAAATQVVAIVSRKFYPAETFTEKTRQKLQPMIILATAIS